jgi:glyoxylase-like metal-dependent hydrolase (beta-lactamase superfamily II)
MPAAGPFVEVADRVFVARYPQWDVNVGLVVGGTDAMLVDTRASAVQGRELAQDVRRLGLGVRVSRIVSTHVHFDHTFGSGAFPDATVHAHERVAATFVDDAERLKALVRADPDASPELGYTAQDLLDVLDTTPRAPDATFVRATTLDLGGRQVELRYAGRGHTDGDIAVHVPDAQVTFLGDLIEESAPPALGGDSWPLDWPATLTAHAARLQRLVVPGHGLTVDAAFVAHQRDDLGALVDVIRERHAAGVPLEVAQREPDPRLSQPLDRLEAAFARVYAQLNDPT